MDLDKHRMIAVVGDIDSGKTNLAAYHLRQYKGQRQIYTLGYPNQLDNFIPLSKKQDLDRITNGIIFIDELTKFFPCRERHTNEEFLHFARVMAHTGNTIIFTTQLTQDLTNKMEMFVDCFLITKMKDLRFLKKGSAAKNAVMDSADIRLTPYSFNLKQGEYYECSDNNPIGQNKVKSFPFQNIGKQWNINVVNNGSCAQSCAQSCARVCAPVGAVIGAKESLDVTMQSDNLNAVNNTLQNSENSGTEVANQDSTKSPFEATLNDRSANVNATNATNATNTTLKIERRQNENEKI